MLTNAYLLDIDQHTVLASAIGRDEESAVRRAVEKAQRQLRHLGSAASHYLARNCRAHLVVANPGAQERGEGLPMRSYMLCTSALARYLEPRTRARA